MDVLHKPIISKFQNGTISSRKKGYFVGEGVGFLNIFPINMANGGIWNGIETNLYSLSKWVALSESFWNFFQPGFNPLGFSALFNAQPFQCIIFQKLSKLKHMWKKILNFKQTRKFSFQTGKVKLIKFQTFTHMKNSDTCFCPMDQEKPLSRNIFSKWQSFIKFSDKIYNLRTTVLIAFPSRNLCPKLHW